MSGFRLYFAQHGLALDNAVDPQRPLSDAGKQQTQAVASKLLSASIPIKQVFHSGKLRAEQTARIFASTLQIDHVCAIDQLSPNDDVTIFASSLTVDGALYVGHLPHLEKLVAYLLSGNENCNIIKFRNSATLCLLKSDGHDQLQWHLIPELAIN
mgnify:CR=1 FL=1